MARISSGEAIGAGFRVIARHPGAILLWAVAYLLLGLLPKVAAFALIAPDFMAMVRQAGLNPAAGDAAFADMWRMQSHLMAYNGVSLLTTLLLHAVLSAAVFRAVLEETNSGFGYLRLGAQELWLVVVTVAFWILLILVMLLAMIPVIVGAAAIGAAGDHNAAGGLGMVGLCLGILVLLVWLCLRFSMALPMTFARRQFMLFESWGLTKGHAWGLFGVALALVAIILLAELVIGGVIVALVGGTGLAHKADFQALARRSPAELIAAISPWLLGFGVVLSLAGAAIYAIMLAPWAEIYRQLTAVPPGPADFDAP